MVSSEPHLLKQSILYCPSTITLAHEEAPATVEIINIEGTIGPTRTVPEIGTPITYVLVTPTVGAATVNVPVTRGSVGYAGVFFVHGIGVNPPADHPAVVVPLVFEPDADM
jgi:hypothetical protein